MGLRFSVVHSGWAEVRLERAPGPDALFEELECLRDERDFCVALFDLSHGYLPALGLNERELRRLERFELPLVACFAGKLAGLDLAFVLACDVRVCDEKSQALIGELGAYGRRRLDVVSGGRAEGDRLTADEALRAGVVSAVAPAGQARAEGERVCNAIARRGPIAVRLAKEAVWRGLEMPFEQALRFETDLTLLAQTTKDRAEGVLAFIEKREPQFLGE